MKYLSIFFLILISFASCKENSSKDLFTLKDNTAIGAVFSNDLVYDNDFNVYKYRNFYNGGGVSLGDINNDGLVDVYLVANQSSNKLFLNKGNWKFEDITKSAGVAGDRAWSTGVTMVDINADGLLDIYLCNSGDVAGDNKENELFINQGNNTFKESAAAYNLNDKGYSTHASFFDYDKDGDLDLYILNNSFQAIGSFNLKKNERPQRDELGGDKLMRNDNGKFVDVSEAAGIYGSVIGFGLGITVGDVNNDNWEDIFISNDFFERDYLYLNNQDGTFTEDLVNQMPSISGASMGADIGDINNDGYNEIFVTEMLPFDYERLKTVTTFDSWNRYQYSVDNGYHHQYTRNFLHLNNGNSTFSDISRFSGVDASDWSWGALFFDMNNDGNKDLYIANGIYKDLTNQDYLQYISSESVMKSIISDKGVDYKELIDIIPSNKIANHAYINKGNLGFSKYDGSGLQTEGFSNGSAYGDLDNDGDMDLVVNNVNMQAFFYENHTNTNTTNNYLKFNLKGNAKNTFGIGAKIKITAGDKSFYIEHQPTRGFQSSIDFRPNIGLGDAKEVDVEVTWSSGKKTRLSNVKTNQELNISEAESKAIALSVAANTSKQFKELPTQIDFKHAENRFVDFNKEPLNYHMLSTQGPCVSYGDLDGDGEKDLVIPGPRNSITKIYFSKNGKLVAADTNPAFEKSKDAEHTECEIFDVDNDGDLDLYLASGGSEMSRFSGLLNDQLFINDGKGNFSASKNPLPFANELINTGAICHGDIDQDGDEDIFLGARAANNSYGKPVSGYIFENDGQGNYVNSTEKKCPQLLEIGLITDATFVDLDNDNQLDLVVVGEFMNISIFKNSNGSFQLIETPDGWSGWWNTIEAVDIDNDGDQDLVIGNHGLNSRFEASIEHPIKMFFEDFDGNGFGEGIMTMNRLDGKDYPVALRHSLTARMPVLKKKYPDFDLFKSATINDMFSPESLEAASKSKVDELRSIVLKNNGSFSFEKIVLPERAQFSPVYAMTEMDLNKDGYADLILGGNLYKVQPEMGRYDASYGVVLINDQKGNFIDRTLDYGFSVRGEVRDFVVDGNILHVFRNNDVVLSYQIK